MPVHLSSNLSSVCLFFFFFLLLCRIVFAKPEDLETWLNHLSFPFLTRVRSSSCSPMAAWFFLQTSSLVTWSLYEMFNSLRYNLISKACHLFSNSAVKVHDSQAYRNMEMTREGISRYVVISPDWLQLCKSCSGLCSPLENLLFGAIADTTALRYLSLSQYPASAL